MCCLLVKIFPGPDLGNCGLPAGKEAGHGVHRRSWHHGVDASFFCFRVAAVQRRREKEIDNKKHCQHPTSVWSTAAFSAPRTLRARLARPGGACDAQQKP